MKTIKLIYELLRLLVEGYKFLKGEIEEHVYLSRIKAIQEGVNQAKDGPLDKRLDGGKKVEDNFNRHAPD